MRIYAAVLAAALAWFVGKALNVPVWNEGHGWGVMGDRTDMAVTAGLFVLALLEAVKRDRVGK